MQNPSRNIAWRIDLQLRVPMYTEDDDPGTRIARDASGRPVFQRSIEVPAALVVPPSVLRPCAAPARFLHLTDRIP